MLPNKSSIAAVNADRQLTRHTGQLLPTRHRPERAPGVPVQRGSHAHPLLSVHAGYNITHAKASPDTKIVLTTRPTPIQAEDFGSTRSESGLYPIAATVLNEMFNRDADLRFAGVKVRIREARINSLRTCGAWVGLGSSFWFDY